MHQQDGMLTITPYRSTDDSQIHSKIKSWLHFIDLTAAVRTPRFFSPPLKIRLQPLPNPSYPPHGKLLWQRCYGPFPVSAWAFGNRAEAIYAGAITVQRKR